MIKRAIIGGLVAVLTGCSLSQRIESVSDDVLQNYREIKIWDELPQRTISWQQALAMMKRSNADILQAESAIRKAERETISVYTDMIPGLSYYGYMNKSINALSDSVSAEDLSSRINVTFSVPTLTQVPYRVYASKVRAYAAIKAKEGKLRELESRLYKTIRLHAIEQRKKAHDAKNPDKDRAKLEAADADKNQYWKDIAEIIGNYEARWQILPESVPQVKWANYRNRLEKLDPLVVCRFAMELEQARMAQYGVALRYLPTINTSLYSPSLFSSSGGTYEGSFLDGEDTRLNLSISYTLDTQLRNWDQYENSKEQYELAKRKVMAAMIEHKNKVHRLRESVDEYHNWRRFMQKRIAFVRDTPVSSSAAFLEREKALHEMQAELISQEKASVESEAAILLEYGFH